MVDVLLVRTDDRVKGMKILFSHYKTLFESLKDKQVAIKPNFNTADPPPASTDINIIRELITHLQSQKVNKITVAERAGPADTHETMKTKGIFDLKEKIGGFDIVDLTKLTESEWEIFKPTESHWKDGFPIPKLYREVEAIIALPCLKTHRFGGHFTLSLKLAVGLVPRQKYMQELHSSPHQRDLIAEINQAYSPDLIILDGVDAFVEGGPEKGKLVHPNVMIVSTDRIAIDAVGVAVLRDQGTTPEVSKGKIFEQDQIARAVELDLGVKDPSEIKIIGIDSESEQYATHLQGMLKS
ncbi:MAG: DUF362 domain-containing protein [Candidatus Hodarchaeales archaeon]|jgi:uncharacterized protein (DUF362 family)